MNRKQNVLRACFEAIFYITFNISNFISIRELTKGSDSLVYILYARTYSWGVLGDQKSKGWPHLLS